MNINRADASFRKVHAYIVRIMNKIKMCPCRHIPYPYTSVTVDETIYGTTLFCWDSHHMALRYAYDGMPDYFKHLIDNLLHCQRRDGFTPNCINKWTGDEISFKLKFHAQPFLMQGTGMYLDMTKDVSWLKRVFGSLEKYLAYYEKNMKTPEGLFAWPLTWMGGLDNDIPGTLFEPNVVISPDLSSRIYMEYKAAAALAMALSDRKTSRSYADRAEKLKRTINRYFWNKKNESYVAWNRMTGESVFSLGDKFVNSLGIGRYSFQSFSNMVPLYAGIATASQAQAVIEKYLLSPDHFRCTYGVRSLSKSSEYYNNAVWGNPPRFTDKERLTNSNWQGPVWILNCHMAVNILLNYGYRKEANALARDTVALLSHSLDSLGSFTENYDAETGAPLYVAKFASWDILGDILKLEIAKPDQRKLMLFIR